jgi:hypothetical protein
MSGSVLESANVANTGASTSFISSERTRTRCSSAHTGGASAGRDDVGAPVVEGEDAATVVAGTVVAGASVAGADVSPAASSSDPLQPAAMPATRHTAAITFVLVRIGATIPTMRCGAGERFENEPGR